MGALISHRNPCRSCGGTKSGEWKHKRGCGPCNKRRADARIAATYQYIAGEKLKRGCVDCGYKAAACALDFDHIDPETKRDSVSSMLTYARATIREEIDKCVVRCANCHRIKTKKLREQVSK